MLPLIARRILATIPVMGVVALTVFGLLHLTPGDPAVIIAGDYATTQDIERIRARLGLDRPVLAQAGIWLASVAPNWRTPRTFLRKALGTTNWPHGTYGTSS